MALKKYIYKIYTSAGVFISNLDDVTSEPVFSMKINGSLSDMTLRLARKFDSFGEEVDISLNNEIRVFCVDGDEPNGKVIYSGYISGYKPILDQSNEYVELTLLPYITTLEDDILNNAGATTVAYSSQDPTDMIADILTKHAGKITKEAGADTGASVTYTFNTTTYLQAIAKCQELSYVGWFYYVGADNKLRFQATSETADHTLRIGKEIISIQPEKRIENVKNVVLFVGDSIFKKYERAGSISTYGKKVEVMQDTRVSNEATADIMAGRFLDQHETPEIRTFLRIIDNTNNPDGYDIESFKVGDVISVKGYGTDYPQSLWDSSVWDEASWDYSVAYATRNPMQVVSLRYEPNVIDLELSSKPVSVQNRIEDIYRRVKDEINNSNPSTPTS